MPFYQNPFFEDFEGTWILGGHLDQQIVFKVPRNAGRDDRMVVAWNDAPFDLSGADADGNANRYLNIRFSLSSNFQGWALLTVDLGTSSTATNLEVVNTLNANTEFAAWFAAQRNVLTGKVEIRALLPDLRIRFFVVNGGAEEKLGFNARAGITEIPAYFDRHKVAYLFADENELNRYPDSVNKLIPLDPSGSSVDTDLVDNAVDGNGVSRRLDSGTIREDWEMLKGRSSIFKFQKMCLDSAGNISQIVEYFAGMDVGDLAKKICYFRNGGALGAEPYQITEEPYVLTAGDLIRPDSSECVDGLS